MTTPPAAPKIYHITHVDNLASILQRGKIHSDRRVQNSSQVGMNHIKARRLALDVKCHPQTKVGEYVPFYFCPRSIMLYILYRGNHPDLSYQGGQTPIIHLEASLHGVIEWADKNSRKWAFSTSNAGASYTSFYNQTDELGQVNWSAVGATDFRPNEIKEGKQAEFLLYEEFPFELVERIGVINQEMKERVRHIIDSSDYEPIVCEKRDWYF